MPRQANGTYLAPASTAAISGGTISSTAFNTLETDIGTEITNSVDRLGRSAMQANLPMGGNIITGHGMPSVSTDVPNKAYVDLTVAAFFSTGDIKPTFKAVADTGWLFCDDGTFGSATSGSSNRANADTQPLFTLFFNNMVDAAAPILTSGGGATTRAAQVSAAAAWAANCRMTLPKMMGRSLTIAGAGAGLSGRNLGLAIGAEAVTLAANHIPSLTSAGNNSISVTSTVSGIASNANLNTILVNSSGTLWLAGNNVGPMPIGAITSTGVNSISVTYSNGAQVAVTILPPLTHVNAMVKL